MWLRFECARAVGRAGEAGFGLGLRPHARWRTSAGSSLNDKRSLPRVASRDGGSNSQPNPCLSVDDTEIILYVIDSSSTFSPFDRMHPTPNPDYRDAMERLLGCAVLCHGAEALADLAGIDMATLLRQSGLRDVAEDLEIVVAAEALRSEIQIGAEFARVLEDMDDRRRIIARKRTYAREPEKLAVLGREFGVSRERVRQLEVRLCLEVERAASRTIETAGEWLAGAVGMAAAPERFDRILELLVGDAPPRWRAAAEVAVMRGGGYEYLDGVVGSEAFRELAGRVQLMAPTYANEVGVIDEDALRKSIAAIGAPDWDALARNAGLVRIGESLVLRDTRRARVFLALRDIGEASRRDVIANVAGLRDNSSLSSLLSSDPLFARFTKDKWGLSEWSDDPYEGVVDAIVKRIVRAGGEVPVASLVEEIPARCVP